MLEHRLEAAMEVWSTEPKKRPRSQPAASGAKGSKDEKGDKEGTPPEGPWPPHDRAGEEQEEEASLESRIKDLEVYMGRVSESIGGLRRSVADTANEVKDIQADLKEVKSWTTWLSRFYKWAGDSYRYFPWR